MANFRYWTQIPEGKSRVNYMLRFLEEQENPRLTSSHKYNQVSTKSFQIPQNSTGILEEHTPQLKVEKKQRT